MTLIIAKEHVVDLNGITLLSPFLSLECGSWRKTIAPVQPQHEVIDTLLFISKAS